MVTDKVMVLMGPPLDRSIIEVGGNFSKNSMEIFVCVSGGQGLCHFNTHNYLEPLCFCGFLFD